MEAYLFKSTACLFILFLFYKLVLENETMHRFKRFYLLGALALAFVIPWITFTSYIETTTALTAIPNINSESISTERQAATNYLPGIAWTIYGIGVCFFALRFFINLKDLIVKIKQNPKLKHPKITHVLLQKEVTPHTFFRYIFLNKRRFEAHAIPSEVLIHEQTHAIQKHSIDILFIEIIQILCWFHPLVYFIKHAIKLNHEFLADQAVLQHGIAPRKYQNLVLAFSSNATPVLANSIHYSFIKKRFTVMKKTTTKRQSMLRSLVFLPIVALLIFGFSTKKTVQKIALSPETTVSTVSLEDLQMYTKIASFWNTRFAQPNAERIIPLSELKKLESIYYRMSETQKFKAPPFPACTPPEKATPEQLAEYNKLARKYNAMNLENRVVKKKDVEKLHLIYNLMTESQRKKSEPFPKFPPFPDVPEAPTVLKGKNDTDTTIPPPPPAPKAPGFEQATTTELNTYNTLANKYKFATQNKMEIQKEEVTTLNYIYSKMSVSQQQRALPYPNFPPPPPGAFPTADPAGFIIEMAKKGATFYLGKEEISSEKAIQISRENSSFQFEVTNENSKNPMVVFIGC